MMYNICKKSAICIVLLLRCKWTDYFFDKKWSKEFSINICTIFNNFFSVRKAKIFFVLSFLLKVNMLKKNNEKTFHLNGKDVRNELHSCRYLTSACN